MANTTTRYARRNEYNKPVQKPYPAIRTLEQFPSGDELPTPHFFTHPHDFLPSRHNREALGNSSAGSQLAKETTRLDSFQGEALPKYI